jgi:hypothetical protein
MTEIEQLRRIVDARIRPAQPAAATVADRRAGVSAPVSGRTRMLGRYDHSTGSEVTYGRYGRTRYGASRYSGG